MDAQRRSAFWCLLAAAGLGLGAAYPARTQDSGRPADRSPPPRLLVFAAASLTDVLDELSAAFSVGKRTPVQHSFAASSLLARQIEAGSRAEVFISADPQWVDYLDSRGLLLESSRRDLAGNRLVLIAPASSQLRLTIQPRFALAAALGSGRLALADPDIVPAGRYARAALQSLGVWDDVSGRLAVAENVRVAVTYVARGDCPLGIVYATDAATLPQIRVIATFPDNTHPPITYSAALTRSAGAEASAYLAFLSSDAAQKVWRKHGFRGMQEWSNHSVRGGPGP